MGMSRDAFKKWSSPFSSTAKRISMFHSNSLCIQMGELEIAEQDKKFSSNKLLIFFKRQVLVCYRKDNPPNTRWRYSSPSGWCLQDIRERRSLVPESDRFGSGTWFPSGIHILRYTPTKRSNGSNPLWSSEKIRFCRKIKWIEFLLIEWIKWLLPPANVVFEGYDFTGVCLSTRGGMGRYPPPGTRYSPRDQVHPLPRDQVHPPGTRYTPRTRYTP